VDLAFANGRVYDHAEIVDRRKTVNSNETSFRIDLDFAGLAAVGIVWSAAGDA
jgi:hypothetical protein